MTKLKNRLTNLPKVKQLVKAYSLTEIQAIWLQHPGSSEVQYTGLLREWESYSEVCHQLWMNRKNEDWYQYSYILSPYQNHNWKWFVDIKFISQTKYSVRILMYVCWSMWKILWHIQWAILDSLTYTVGNIYLEVVPNENS